jgi:hypothetical protein
MPRLSLGAMTMVLVLAATPVVAQSSEPYEQPPINYSATQPRDAISALQKRLPSSALKLTGNGKEIVQDLLRELHIPVESQTLVFSKTSFQRPRIRPEQPRAIYFPTRAMSVGCRMAWSRLPLLIRNSVRFFTVLIRRPPNRNSCATAIASAATAARSSAASAK